VLREEVADGIGERRGQACEDGQHPVSLPERRSPVCCGPGGARGCLREIELPGHTPGSIGLIDDEEGALLSGDAVHEGGQIDTLPRSDVEQYVRTMQRLRTLDVDVVYPGHGRPFGRERLREIAADYLRRRN